MRKLRLTALVCSMFAGLVMSPAGALADAAGVLERAPELLRQGRLVEVKQSLLSLDRKTLSSVQRDEVLDLLAATERRLRYADAVDVSIQKAELAIREGDLREADRQIGAVQRSDTASSEQRDRAAQLKDEADARRRELAPLMESLFDAAVSDFQKERFAEAKAGFDRVYRSGVALSADQLRTLDAHVDRIAKLERERGEAFDVEELSLGVLQPGRVTTDRPATQQQGATEQEENLFQEALRFDAERLIAEADFAFQEGRFNEALEKYSRAAAAPYREHLTADTIRRAETRITEARVLLQQAGARELDEVIEVRRIRLEQARVEFNNFVQQAEQALSAGDTERARALAGEARLRLADAREVFSETEYQQLLARQQNLLQNIVTTEERIRVDEQRMRDTRLAEESRVQEAERQRERSEAIRENLLRIRALQEEQKYREALQVVEQLLFIDPQNPAGLLLKDTLQDVMIYRDWSQTQRSKSLSYAREMNTIQDSLVIPENILDYPSDWPEISFRRGAAETFAESPADRRVLAELESRRIPATFTDNALEDVINFVATVTNLNVDVDWDSLADIGVDRDSLVTLNLQPLPARVVLDRVLQKVSPDTFSRASWAVNDGVLVVASDSALRKNTFIVIYDVQDLLFQVPSFREVPDLDLGAIQQGGGGGGQQVQVETEEGDKLTRAELLARIIEIIQTNVDTDGWRDNGGDTGAIQELNGNLIVTNTARNHRNIAHLLRQLREVRAIQINVEARFLLVNEDFFEQIGFDLDVVFNAKNSQFEDAVNFQDNFSQIQLPDSGRRNLLPSDLVAPFFGGPRFDGTFNMQLINANELAQPGNTDLPQFQIQDTPFVVTAPDQWSQVPVQQGSKSLAQSLFGGGTFANAILSQNPALGVAATFLDDIQVDMLLEATQADRRSVTLTSPRLTFTNGSAATISVVTQRAFVSDLQPIVGTRSVAFDPQPGVVSDGFFLLVDGVVSADRRYVTMEIQSGVSQLEALEEFQVSAQTTGGGAEDEAPDRTFQANLQQPTIRTTIIRTGATVPDQGTLLLGGQRFATEVEIETGVPVLSQIPILNRLFTNRIDAKEEQTLLILLKPTILIQNEEEEKNFPGLLDSLQSRFGAGL